MSRRGLQGQAAELLSAGDSGDRFVDLAIDLREWDGRTSIMQVGGRWDKERREWCGDADTQAVWLCQPAQYEAAYWFAEWLAAYAAGERLEEWPDVYVAMLEGGRGAGKTDFGVKACAIFALAMRDRIVWDVSPVLDEIDEIRRTMDAILSPTWCVWIKSELLWRFWNGSEIQLKSGFKPESLKAGRVDMWLLNEAQRFSKDAYLMARPRLSDTSGLGWLACNPPRLAKGRWVGEFHTGVEAGSILDITCFPMDNELNPTLDWHSLELLKETFGDADYRREVLGEFVPIGDLVFYAWSPHRSGNLRPMPEVGDITREVTKREFGREFDVVLGVDFQLTPHQACVAIKFFAGEDGQPLMWIFDEVAVVGTEDDLIDVIEAHEYKPDSTIVIADATGDYQGSERIKGKGSFDMFKRRGWMWIRPPDKTMRKNPLIIERVQATNARMCDSNGVRRMFSVPDLHYWNKAAQHWENRNGMPYRKSEFAHFGDAGSYVCWRFFPRKHVSGKVSYKRVERKKSKRERDMGRF